MTQFRKFTPSFRPDPKAEPIIKGKKPMEAKKKPTGERALFSRIWNTRPRRSFVSGDRLGVDAQASFFAHVLSKAQNKYPEFKLYDRNIVLLTAEEHRAYDHGSRHKLKGPGWAKLFALEAELKEEYKKLTNKK